MLSGHDFLMATSVANELYAAAEVEIAISVDSAKTVLVPAELYAPDMAVGYMCVNDRRPNDDECVIAATKGDIVALMALERRIVQLFENPLWRVTYHSPLLDGVVSYARAVRISLTANNCYVTISDNGKLLYAEAFATTEPDNIAFVLGKLREVLRIDGFEVRISGEGSEAVVERLSSMFKDCKQA